MKEQAALHLHFCLAQRSSISGNLGAVHRLPVCDLDARQLGSVWPDEYSTWLLAQLNVGRMYRVHGSVLRLAVQAEKILLHAEVPSTCWSHSQ